MTTTIHTSELLNSCPKQAQLRIEGKEHRTATTALVRGLVAHAALEHITCEPEMTTDSAVELGWDETARKLLDEGRTMTAAVIADEDAIKLEIEAVCDKYREHMAGRVHELVGCEIPISLDIDIDGEPIRFESHADKVYVGADPLTGEQAVVLIDWKYHATVPSSAYLARNLQIGLYQYAAMHGGLQVDGWPWIMPDGLPLRAYWCHLPNFKPYGRKTTVVEDGEPVEYQKGDTRPPNRIFYAATLNSPERMLEALAVRVRMMRADIWPAMPDPTGCYLCQSSYACDAWGDFA
jgi:hypothetical protein